METIDEAPKGHLEQKLRGRWYQIVSGRALLGWELLDLSAGSVRLGRSDGS